MECTSQFYGFVAAVANVTCVLIGNADISALRTYYAIAHAIAHAVIKVREVLTDESLSRGECGVISHVAGGGGGGGGCGGEKGEEVNSVQWYSLIVVILLVK